eukprot:8232475-Pyramimonas_sp.AAC.1
MPQPRCWAANDGAHGPVKKPLSSAPPDEAIEDVEYDVLLGEHEVVFVEAARQAPRWQSGVPKFPPRPTLSAGVAHLSCR